ncbi:MAG: T6SS phospholipase effector Tle1-like catalytic domain-containing protein [Anaerolineales bacterium]
MRQRHLLDTVGAVVPVPQPAEPGGRRIVICCDGTGNRPDQEDEGSPATTNVWKLYRTLICDETQVTWYQAGVGSDSSSTAAQARRTHRVLQAVGTDAGAQVAAFGQAVAGHPFTAAHGGVEINGHL